MCIHKELIKPNSPEHFDYFLGWFYRSNYDFKMKIWELICAGEKVIEFNEFYFIIDFDNKLISIRSIYDSRTHNSFFSREEWELNVEFNEFEIVTGIKTIDYDSYYRTKDDCGFAIIILEEIPKELKIGIDILEDIKNQINLMYKHMDLNYFYPNYHLFYKEKLKNSDFLLFLYELAISYIKYAKPVDIISKSNLCR
ncbi:hypothetical protein A4G20_08300 [Pasteurellaceae bacterium RH1A]|nr:hypothetical protein A4G20_08300 [Pasteurellaceae bacterium RH1A]